MVMMGVVYFNKLGLWYCGVTGLCRYVVWCVVVKVLCSPTNAAVAAKLQPCKVCCRDNRISLQLQQLN